MMAGTFRSIVFPERRKVEVRDLPTAAVPAPGPGRLRCRALTSLVSTGTESFCLDGTFDDGTFWQEWVQYPFAPGYSMTSTVQAVGPGVTAIAVGERVATSTPHTEVFLVDAAEAVVVPADVSDAQACWASLACTTQLGVRRAELVLGETVVVVGRGTLGQLVVQYLRLSGARRIIGVDPVQARLELAEAAGATHLLRCDAATAVERVHEITSGEMADVAFDVTGHAAVLAPTTTMVRPMGRVVLLGDSPTPSLQRLGPRMVAGSVTLIGVHASSAPGVASGTDPWTLPAMTALFFDYLRSGRMDVDHLHTHTFSPREAEAIYDNLRRDRSGFLGVFLDWKGTS
jgi:threonine dehydrogenase-like Zn-dependent dehydrogenase